MRHWKRSLVLAALLVSGLGASRRAWSVTQEAVPAAGPSFIRVSGAALTMPALVGTGLAPAVSLSDFPRLENPHPGPLPRAGEGARRADEGAKAASEPSRVLGRALKDRAAAVSQAVSNGDFSRASERLDGLFKEKRHAAGTDDSSDSGSSLGGNDPAGFSGNGRGNGRGGGRRGGGVFVPGSLLLILNPSALPGTGTALERVNAFLRGANVAPIAQDDIIDLTTSLIVKLATPEGHELELGARLQNEHPRLVEAYEREPILHLLNGASPSAAAVVQAAAPESLPNERGGINDRFPTGEESVKIRESLRRSSELSDLAADLRKKFEGIFGSFRVDPNPEAAYHGQASASGGAARITLTADTLNNTPWAFIAAIIAREQTWFNGFYKSVPDSVEKLAVAYGHMVMVFADITNSSTRAWSTNLDHVHKDGDPNKPYVWDWYFNLLQAALRDAFTDSVFFNQLRNKVAAEISDNPAFRYSLYERYEGVTEDGRTVPDSLRIDKDTYRQAKKKLYGDNGQGDDDKDPDTQRKNFLGLVRTWFRDRGEK